MTRYSITASWFDGATGKLQRDVGEPFDAHRAPIVLAQNRAVELRVAGHNQISATLYDHTNCEVVGGWMDCWVDHVPRWNWGSREPGIYASAWARDIAYDRKARGLPALTSVDLIRVIAAGVSA